MPSQRTGGGYTKWIVWDRKERRVHCGELTLRDAKQTASFLNHTVGTERYVGKKRAAQKEQS